MSFSTAKTRRIIIFLDACYSGTGRAAGLLASARGVKIIPAGFQAPQRSVVFSAAGSMQAAYGYRAKQHGLFTYSLLSKMKQNPGITWGELSEHVKQEVENLSIRENGVLQQPEIKISPEMKESWSSIRINDRIK